MKQALLYIVLFLTLFCVSADVVEKGFVKEYRGKESKTPLPGVELMVKGAPSTISDNNGSFSLRFATLKPGEKVNYAEIYKEGYVIFNKEALDAWRISNSGKPFTIVMCRESEFRALKKKFHGLIEKSYEKEYLRQKAIAEKSIKDVIRLNARLREIEDDYQKKLGDINTYVEIFSRIDRNEMDSVESTALDLLEAGRIDEAIVVYEKLQLTRQTRAQMQKWDAAEEMRRAAEGMESQAQADLAALVDKLRKQLGLYEMGGNEYDDKRLELINEMLPLMYRLNPVSSFSYSEDIARLLLTRSRTQRWLDRKKDIALAAAVPSALGCWALADRLEVEEWNSTSLSDSIRMLYQKAIELAPADSLSEKLKIRQYFIPDGYQTDDAGNRFNFKILNDSNAILTGCNFYFSTPLSGEVTLPDYVDYQGKRRLVTHILTSAFANNHSLRKITLPAHLVSVGEDTFKGCDSLDTIIAGTEIVDFPADMTPHAMVVLPKDPENTDWIIDRINSYYQNDTTRSSYLPQRNKLISTLIAKARKIEEKEWGAQLASEFALNQAAMGNVAGASRFAREAAKWFKPFNKELSMLADRLSQADNMRTMSSVISDSGTENKKPSADKTKIYDQNLRNYIDIVQAIAKGEMKRIDSSNLMSQPPYEELVSIGIIAVQHIIKDKTPEQMKKYNSAYVATVVRNAIRNELSYRYEWYNLTSPALQDASFEVHADEIKNMGYDPLQLKTVINIYGSIREAHENLIPGSEIKNVFDKMWEAILFAGSAFDGENARFFNFITSGDPMETDIIQTFGPKLIVATVNTIRESLNARNFYGYGVTESSNDKSEAPTDNENSQTSDAMKKILSEYLEIAEFAAKMEHSRLLSIGVKSDLSDLSSIAVIALKLMAKSKSPEQLKKYSPLYLYSAFSWAIRKEMKIRNPEMGDVYDPDEEALKDNRLLPLIIFDNIRRIRNEGTSLHPPLALKEMADKKWETAIGCLPSIPEGMKPVASDFFSSNMSISDLLKKYPSDSIITLSDSLKEILRNKL